MKLQLILVRCEEYLCQQRPFRIADIPAHAIMGTDLLGNSVNTAEVGSRTR